MAETTGPPVCGLSKINMIFLEAGRPRHFSHAQRHDAVPCSRTTDSQSTGPTLDPQGLLEHGVNISGWASETHTVPFLIPNHCKVQSP